jgi:hypothetical protein
LASPVTFTATASHNKNRHMCWYGTSGAGIGYSLRVLPSREHFANGLRVYGIDRASSRSTPAASATACVAPMEWRPESKTIESTALEIGPAQGLHASGVSGES